MPALADSIAALEHAHEDALAKLEALTNTHNLTTDLVKALTSEKAALEAQVAQLGTHSSEMLAMVESVANSALAMLRTAKIAPSIPALTTATIGALIPSATVGLPALDLATRIGKVLINDDMLKPDAVPQAALIDSINARQNALRADFEQKMLPELSKAPFTATPEQVEAIIAASPNAQQVVADIMANDSTAAPVAAPEQIDAIIAEHIDAITATPEPVQGDSGDESDHAPLAPFAEPPATAVDLMKRHLLPPVTLVRAPAPNRAALVEQQNVALPIFLQRDTVFQRGDSLPAGQVFNIGDFQPTRM